MSPTSATDRPRDRLLSLALAALVLALHLPVASRTTLAFPGVDLGPHDGWSAGWARGGPAGVAAWCERALTHGSPVANALLGALFAALTAALLFAWARARGHGRGASFLACGLWALHPLAAEPVFLGGARDASLAAFFAALGLLLHARRPSPVVWLAPFLLALALDPLLLGLGVLLLALDARPGSLDPTEGPPPEQPAKRRGAALALVLAGALACFLVPREPPSVPLTGLERWSHAPLALSELLRRLLLPLDVAFSPPHPASIGAARSPVLLGLAWAAWLGLSAAAWRLRRRRPALALGWLWTNALLLPHVVGQRDGLLLAARDVHLASFGVWLAFAAEGRSLLLRRGLSPRRRLELGSVTLLAFVTAGALQERQWSSARALAARALALDARHFTAHDALGIAFLEEGRLSEAAVAHRAALERAPRDARALHQLGIVELRRALIPGLEAHMDPAREHFEDEVALVPRSAAGWERLGEVLQRSELLEEATGALERAVALDPTRVDAWTHLGMVCNSRGQLAQARAAFERARALAPELPDAACGLGILRFQEQDLEGARAELERALALEPDHVASRTMLGRIDELAGDVDGAEREYRHALSVNPDHADALYALAAICEHGGQLDEALRLARRLVEQRPTHVRGNLMIGKVLARQGDVAGASAAFEAVLRLNPNHAEAIELLHELHDDAPGGGR